MYDSDVSTQVISTAAPLIRQTFLRLLEDKHLYQSIEIDPDDLSEFSEKLAKKHIKLEAQVVPTLSGSGSFVKPQSKEDIVRTYYPKPKNSSIGNFKNTISILYLNILLI